jgi:hypothetical protein
MATWSIPVAGRFGRRRLHAIIDRYLKERS